MNINIDQQLKQDILNLAANILNDTLRSQDIINFFNQYQFKDIANYSNIDSSIVSATPLTEHQILESNKNKYIIDPKDVHPAREDPMDITIFHGPNYLKLRNIELVKEQSTSFTYKEAIDQIFQQYEDNSLLTSKKYPGFSFSEKELKYIEALPNKNLRISYTNQDTYTIFPKEYNIEHSNNIKYFPAPPTKISNITIPTIPSGPIYLDSESGWDQRRVHPDYQSDFCDSTHTECQPYFFDQTGSIPTNWFPTSGSIASYYDYSPPPRRTHYISTSSLSFFSSSR